MAGAATQTAKNLMASRVFLRRSNLQVVSRTVLQLVRNDRFLGDPVAWAQAVYVCWIEDCAAPRREAVALRLRMTTLRLPYRQRIVELTVSTACAMIRF
jgi:hypothetical protein